MRAAPRIGILPKKLLLLLIAECLWADGKSRDISEGVVVATLSRPRPENEVAVRARESMEEITLLVLSAFMRFHV